MVGVGTTELETFAKDLLQLVVTEASMDEQESMLAESFTGFVIGVLTELSEWDEGFVCYHRERGAEVSGWGWDPETGTLDLSVTSFEGRGEVGRLPKRDADAALKRVSTFFRLALAGLHADLEESSAAFDLAYLVSKNRTAITRVRLHLFTDSLASTSADLDFGLDDVSVSSSVWDLARLQRLVSSGGQREPIDIDLVARFGEPLRCLPVQTSSNELGAYLLVIPGPVLAKLYNEYGSRLLELNVRSFLQARGKVNRGIRDTILNQPDRFFAYNNGISATASEVELGRNGAGAATIRRIRDLQIVNGGQTTASIATVARKEPAAVAQVSVQAKLTVVPREQITDVVPLISRYANSQNRVSEADLSANHKFHVSLEELSRTIWAPAAEGGTRETRWFYERARGQYQDALSGERTPARKKGFREVHPPKQKFTKTDVGKFENAWSQLPHVVSRGAQKSFVEFMIHVDGRSFSPDKAYFEQLCAKAIMFRRAEQIVSAQKFGGYRANIVAYSISYISHRTAMRVSLDEIWRSQSLGEGLEAAIESVSVGVNEFITSPPGNQNITEWCKKEQCWKKLREMDLHLPSSLDTELVASRTQRSGVVDPSAFGVGQPTREEVAAIEWVSTVPAETWFAIAAWAKSTSQLQVWQRKISFSVGRRVGDGQAVSVKQAWQARILHDKAFELGFAPDSHE